MYNSYLLKTFFNNPTLAMCGDIIDYLNYISGKELSLDTIRQSVLKVKWKENEIKLLNRCTCKAASLYLEFLNKENVGTKEQLRIIIADLLPTIRMIDKVQETEFIVISPNSLPSLIHFEQSRSLFYNKKVSQTKDSSYHLDLLTLYSLRLSFESRIHGLLGIDYVKVNEKPMPLSDLLLICRRMKEIKYNCQLNWDQLIILNKWLNHYMHRHLRPNPWCIHHAFEILKPLLNSTVYKTENREIHSFYASTIINDKDRFRSEFLSELEATKKRFEIKWSFNHEAIILNLK